MNLNRGLDGSKDSDLCRVLPADTNNGSRCQCPTGNSGIKILMMGIRYLKAVLDACLWNELAHVWWAHDSIMFC